MIKTWKVKDCLGRFAEMLIAYGHPFHYDGRCIEFDASEGLVKRFLSEDKLLEKRNEEGKLFV